MSRILSRLQAKIQQTLERAVVVELDAALTSRAKWSRVANISEATGHFMICVAMICAFLASAYKSQEVTVVSGCTNVVSLALIRFARYAADEVVERTEKISEIARRQTVIIPADEEDTLAPRRHTSFTSI